MRVQSSKLMHNGGWWHPFSDESKKRFVPEFRPPPPKPTINAGKIMAEFSAQSWPKLQADFAASLGLSMQSLMALGCAWSVAYHAWAFPMMDVVGNVIGIRLRAESGRKFAVTGSRQGIFIPRMPPQSQVWILEGPTDCCAAYMLDLFCLGRPSCTGGNDLIAGVIRRFKCSEAIIVSDNDGPGVNGALKLAEDLPIKNCILVPPAKDLREFVQLGGTKKLLMSILEATVWRQPKSLTPASATK